MRFGSRALFLLSLCTLLIVGIFRPALLPQFIRNGLSSLTDQVFAVDCLGDSTCENLNKEIEEINKQLQLSVNATKPLESEVNALQKRIDSAQAGITKAKKDAETLARNIVDREATMADKYVTFTQNVRERYKRSRGISPITLLFTSGSASELTRLLNYRQTIEQRIQHTITTIGEEIVQLETDKKHLEERQKQLADLQKQLDTQASFFRKEIAKAKSYQAELTGKIAALSSKQQSILAEKTGTFQTTVGDVPLADDAASSPNYNPGFSPAFAAFSFGAPHFNGLSQYGALGRSKEGQDVETILKAYYGDIEIKKDYDQNATICVGNSASSCEHMSLETYAKRIYEVPNVWGDQGGMEALKAQAVAARSYALADMTRRGYICATESCQVYKGSNKGGNWESAVNATAGWVMMKNGKPLWAKYASTAGGYIDPYTDTATTGHTTPGFWDTKNGRDGWTSQAFEKIANSPWFYKAWYKTRSGATCGRSHPWLNQEEMTDILNAWRVLQHSSDNRVSPLGGCWGGDPYSMNDLRDKANQYGGAFTSINSVSVDYSNSGYTSNVRFSTNQGDVSLSGEEFKKIFNLRAPGNISLKSGLFNVEKK